MLVQGYTTGIITHLVELEAGLMARIYSVHAQLLQAVGVVVAGVALEVNWVPDGHAF